MLTLLRQIRRSLLQSGANRRYLFYALGEFILIVAGILVALQINNWNEWRKDRVKERIVLEELLESLNASHDGIIFHISYLELLDNSSEFILSTIQNRRPYHDSLHVHFNLARAIGTNFNISTSAYEKVKDLGIEIITSDKIKNDLVQLFEGTYAQTMRASSAFNAFQPARMAYIEQLFYFDTHIDFNQTNLLGAQLIPFNYHALMNDERYYGHLTHIWTFRKLIHPLITLCLNDIENLILLIEEELANFRSEKVSSLNLL